MRFRDQLCKQGNSSKRIVIRLNSLDEQHSKADIDIFMSKNGILCNILCNINLHVHHFINKSPFIFV